MAKIADDEEQRKYIERFRNAQKESINWKAVLESEVYDLISTQSEITGCAFELIIFPLLAAVASCMGPETNIQVSQHWVEKAVLWFLIGARRGERKTSALKTVKLAALSLEKEIEALRNGTPDTDAKTNETEKFVIDETSISHMQHIFEKRTSEKSERTSEKCERTSEKNETSSFAVFLDDFENILRKYGFTTTYDLNMFKHLYEGPNTNKDSADKRSKQQKMFVNFAAMIQAAEIQGLIKFPNDHGLLDRLLIVCAPEGGGNRFPTNSSQSTSPVLHSVLSSVRNFHHVQNVTYSFSHDAEITLNRGLQEFQSAKLKYGFDEHCWGASNQASSHVVRLCGVFTALKNGIAMANKGSFLPSRVIDEDTVKRVFVLVRTLLRQKFTLILNSVELEDFNMISNIDMEVEDTTTECSDNVTTSCLDRPDEDVIEINDESEDKNDHMGSGVINIHMAPDDLRITDVRSSAHSDMMIFRDGYTDVAQMSKQETSVYTPQPLDEFENDQPINYGHSVTPSNIDFSANHIMPVHTSSMQKFGQDSFSESKPLFEDSERKQSVEYTVTRPRLAPNFDMKTKYSFSSPRMKPRPRPKQMFVNRATGHLKEKRNFLAPKTPNAVKEDIYKMEESAFIIHCASKIKKLMLTKGLVVTASYACQYRLFPPVPLDQRSNSPRTTHPAWAAAKFFEKLGEMGLGSMLLFRGHSVKFKKRRLEEMEDKGREILRRVSITDEEYERSYPQNTDSVTVGQYQYEFQL